MEFRFKDINVYYNGELSIKNLEIKISHKTTLLFFCGSNLCSLYFDGMDEEAIKEILADELEEYGIETDASELENACKWIKKHYI